MSRYQRMEVGAGRPMELKIYPTTRTGKILTIKQDNFDSVTVPSRTESLLAKRERENEKEGKKKRGDDSFRNFRAFRTSFLRFSHQDR